MKLEILLNRNCNYSCEYCGIYDNNINEKTNVNINFLKKIIRDNNITEVVILGGEPTLNKHFIDIINTLSVLDIFTVVYTNGVISDSMLKQVSRKASFIVSYHKSQTTLRAFMECLENIKKYCDILSIITMWNSPSNLIDYKILSNKFNTDTHFLEPIFDVKNGLMDKSKFYEFSNLGLLGLSGILNNKNRHLDLTFFEMFKLNLDVPNKKCSIDKHSITLDFMESKTYTCLTHCLNKSTKEELCTLSYCLQDLEYIEYITDE